VAVEEVGGSYRLRWRAQGKRYHLFPGLAISKINRMQAEAIAVRIEEDMRTQNFDATLAKYDSRRKPKEVSATELYQRFYDVRASRLAVATLEKYRALLGQVREFYGSKPASVAVDEAIAFMDWLLARGMKPITLRDRLAILNACWDWGIKTRLVTVNPWSEARSALPKIPRLRPQPFTEVEVRQIMEYFATHEKYKWWRDLVEFKLGIGCRTGEIAGLRWRHLSVECDCVEISEALVRRKQKATKTGEIRQFYLSEKLQKLLLNRRPADWQPDDLVFPGPKGAALNANNFARYFWRPCLEALDIPYRKPYNTRSTFSSHAMESGMSPAQIAEITGHSQATLFKHYSGAVRRSRTPDLF
jgi:integrase